MARSKRLLILVAVLLAACAAAFAALNWQQRQEQIAGQRRGGADHRPGQRPVPVLDLWGDLPGLHPGRGGELEL